MSYILDALRRAEADRERERGRVPGLHTQALSGSDTTPAASQRRWLPWAGGGLLLLAGLGAGSWWAGGARDAASTESPQAPQAAHAPLAAPMAAAPAPRPTIQDAVPAPSASPYLPPAPPPAATTSPPAPASRGIAVPAVTPTAASVAAPPSTPPSPPPSPAADTPIPQLSQLPEGTRRDLPKLVISGSIYSDDPASRFVIINGEVQREGAKLGADLVLEQIGPRELVLRFRGQRYRQPV